MRVLLLGCTGNLGSRLLPALLAHGHTVVAYVRNEAKLRSLVSLAVVDNSTIVIGDATDSAGIEQAILNNGCDAVVNTAGTQVKHGEVNLLAKIATAVTTAAISVGKRRGKPMRAWLIGGMGLLRIPESPWRVQDYFPKRLMEQHQGTAAVLQQIPGADLEWSLLCVAMMKPKSEKIDILAAPQPHSFIVKAEETPGWRDRWWKYIPFIGAYINVYLAVFFDYESNLENVADLIAEDLEHGPKDLVGKMVGFKNKEKAQ